MSEEVKKEDSVETTPAVQNQANIGEMPAEPQKKAAPRLFFDEDSRVEVSINGYHSNQTGELAFAVPVDSVTDEDAIDQNNVLGEIFNENLFSKVNYKFWFSRCPYDRYNNYRRTAVRYNQEDQSTTLDEIRLREFLLVYHLVDWNLTDNEGVKIELKFDPKKALSDESLRIIYRLPSKLLDVVLSTYEKKMAF